jgi:hypothetical protein
MKTCIVAGLAAVLLAAELIVAAPSASAGCQYAGPVISKCDGPIQTDGTWQRCVAAPQLIYSGASSFLVPEKHCDLMGPDQHPGDFALGNPPTHIDD